MRRKVMIYFMISLLLLIIAFVIWQKTAYKVDEPKYTVLKSEGPIEIRRYPPLIVAEVKIKGQRYSTINSGFRLLADYIFGNNNSKQKIAMTAPVMQEGIVTSSDATATKPLQDDAWIVRFVMPANFDLASLPHPNNRAITLINLPSKEYIVIRFSGSNSDKNLQDHLDSLLQYSKKHQLNITGRPIMAFYNPPWILPMFKRNEIMLELK